jgi:GNAT superfamily N-acetyltransferase
VSRKRHTIRPLAPGDRPAWDRLWQGYLAFYGVEVAPEVTEQTWARIMDPLVDLHGIAVLGRSGDVAGICHYFFHPATWSVGPYCYLEDLFVDPAERGGGLGRALIEAVYRAADGRGAARVYWHTHEDNAAARRLYDKVASHQGFILYRR